MAIERKYPSPATLFSVDEKKYPLLAKLYAVIARLDESTLEQVEKEADELIAQAEDRSEEKDLMLGIGEKIDYFRFSIEAKQKG